MKEWNVKIMYDDTDELVVWGELDNDYRPIFYINRADASRKEFHDTVVKIVKALNESPE